MPTETIPAAPADIDGSPTGEPTEDAFHVHDGVYSPLQLIEHCARIREEIAERQKHLIDLPV